MLYVCVMTKFVFVYVVTYTHCTTHDDGGLVAQRYVVILPLNIPQCISDTSTGGCMYIHLCEYTVMLACAH